MCGGFWTEKAILMLVRSCYESIAVQYCNSLHDQWTSDLYVEPTTRLKNLHSAMWMLASWMHKSKIQVDVRLHRLFIVSGCLNVSRPAHSQHVLNACSKTCVQQISNAQCVWKVKMIINHQEKGKLRGIFKTCVKSSVLMVNTPFFMPLLLGISDPFCLP